MTKRQKKTSFFLFELTGLKSLLFALVLLAPLFARFAHCKTWDNDRETMQAFPIELHFKSPMGVYFRFGQDITFRKYDRVFSEGDLGIVTNFAINAFIFQVIRASVSSVTRHLFKPSVARESFGVLIAFIFPTLVNHLYSWFTGRRIGSEQVKIADSNIAGQFYIELAYNQSSPNQHIRITPFPDGEPARSLYHTTASRDLSLVDPWQSLHNAAIRNSIDSIDLSWSRHERHHSIRVQLVYHDRHSLTVDLPVTDSEHLPESIESLLHKKMQGQKNHSTSLFNEVVIERVAAIIEDSENAPQPIPASGIINTFEADDQGYIKTLKLCDDKDDLCGRYLKLVWEPLPLPHYRPVLSSSQPAVNSLSSAFISQAANLNKAELLIQLIEQEALRRVINTFRSNGYSHNADSPEADPHNQAPAAVGMPARTVPEQTERAKAELSIIPSKQRVLASALSSAITLKDLLAEVSYEWIFSKQFRKNPILRSLSPGAYTLYMVEPEYYGAGATALSNPPPPSTNLLDSETLHGLQNFFTHFKIKCADCGGPPLFPFRRECACGFNPMYHCQTCNKNTQQRGDSDCPHCKVPGMPNLWIIDNDVLHDINHQTQSILRSSQLPRCSADGCDNRLFLPLKTSNGGDLSLCMSCLFSMNHELIPELQLDSGFLRQNSESGEPGYQDSSQSQLQETNRRWNEFNNLFNRNGVFVKMFFDGPQSGQPFEQVVQYFLSETGTDKWLSASLVIPGYGTPFKPRSNTGGIGFAYPADLLETKAHFRTNAYTQNSDNLQRGLNRCFTPDDRHVKNHANMKSLINKLEEKRYFFHSPSATKISVTSGHIDNKGHYVDGKLVNTMKRNKDTSWSEVIVKFKDQEPHNAVALVLVNLDHIEYINRALPMIDEVWPDNNLPIIYHHGSGAFRLLGSVNSFRQWWNGEHIANQYYNGLPSEPPMAMPDSFFDIMAGVFTRLLQGHSALSNSGSSIDMPEHENYSDWVSYLGFFKSKFSADALLPNLMSTVCFADNISRFIELLIFHVVTEKYPLAFNEEPPPYPSLVLGNDIRAALARSVLVASTYRQFLESTGIEFNDDETILLSFAAIFSCFKNQYGKNQYETHYPSVEEFGYFIKTAPSGLRDNILKALRTPRVKLDWDDRFTVYAHILRAVNFLKPGAKNADYILFEATRAMNGEQRTFATEIIRKISNLPVRWNYHAPLDQSAGTLAQHMEFFKKNPLLAPPDSKITERVSWPRIIRRLQEDVMHTAAEKLRSEAVNAPPPHYTEHNLSLPRMTLLELVSVLGSGRGSKEVDRLVRHYLDNGIPRLTGTIDNARVSNALLNAVKLEQQKKPSAEHLSSIFQAFPNVRLRDHETALPLGYDFSILQNLDKPGSQALPSAATVARPQPLPRRPVWNLVAPSGKIRFKKVEGTEDTKAKAQQAIKRFQSVSDSENCPICTYPGKTFVQTPCCHHNLHTICLQKSLVTASGKCPYCRHQLLELQGPQPSGTMSWETVPHTCMTRECYNYFFKIKYETPEGRFRYDGDETAYDYPRDKRIAYIPATEKGLKAFWMLQEAYRKGHVLTVGYSQTRNIDDVVVWGGPPHKTQIHDPYSTPTDHAYPDAGYLDRLINCLKGIGISEPETEIKNKNKNKR